jgi:hypothetical protein
MYCQNLSAAVNSAIGVALAAPYTGESNCIRYLLTGKFDGNSSPGLYGYKSIEVRWPTTATLIWANSYGNTSADANRTSRNISTAVPNPPGNPWLRADRTYWWRTRVKSTAEGNINGGYTNFKTISAATTFGTPTIDGPTQSTIDVSVPWYPNTAESAAVLTLSYKKSTESTWTEWDTTSGSQSGYTLSTFNATVTGLDAGTTYQFKVDVTRTTIDNLTASLQLPSLATIPNVPTVTTNPATTIGYLTAQLNATVDPNTVSTTLTFEYGTVTLTYPNTGLGTVVVTGDGDQAQAFSLTGLAASTTYYYRAKVTYDLGAGDVDIYGAEQSFATSSDPGEEAREEELMQTVQYDGQYATAKTLTFTLRTEASSGSDEYFNSDVPVTADVLVIRDGTYYGTANAAVTQVTSAIKLMQIILDTDEMTGEVIDVLINDTTALGFRDAHLQVRTAQRLSELDLDATNGPTDATALTATGNGAGDGIKATGGATGKDINAVMDSNWLRVGAARTQDSPSASHIRLDTGSATTNDYYNGALVAIIAGTGVGQGRIAVDYVGGSDAEVDGNREIEIDTPWLVTPDDNSVFALAPGPRVWEMKSPGELSTIPTEESSYGEFLRLLFQRFAFRIEQDADFQTWFQADNSTQIFSRAVEDSGTLQRLYRLQNY